MKDFICGGVGNGVLCAKGCARHPDKLNTYNWLANLPADPNANNLVEVQFKPPRKSYFVNSNNLPLATGDVVAVEANPGHDIGTITLTGPLVQLQMKKAHLKPDFEPKRIYRLARKVDIDKYREAKALEHETMIESRQIAKNLGLKMKIGDVEYQGDGNKAIFYYIADERVDFRQLIKVLAERFRVRIEMKQIGARQEAGRIGGIGPCGRELCCATWMTRFSSVSTAAARFQDVSLNPQKLAGQCAKLKCCLNYEADQYVEALRQLPSREISLYTADAEYHFFKSDTLQRLITYSTDKHLLVNAQTITAQRAFEIIRMNHDGQKPQSLQESGTAPASVSKDLLDQENITRFDRSRAKKKQRKPRPQDNAAHAPGNAPSAPQQAAPQQAAPKRNPSRNPAERQAGERKGGKRPHGGKRPDRNDNRANDNAPQ